MKIVYVIFLSIIIAAAKNYRIGNLGKKDLYFVMTPHTPEQCRRAMEGMKERDEVQLSKFYFGCNYNDHTFYGTVEGTSVEDVRNSLPPILQTNAKIKKVDKLSVSEIEKLHIGEASGANK